MPPTPGPLKARRPERLGAAGLRRARVRGRTPVHPVDGDNAALAGRRDRLSGVETDGCPACSLSAVRLCRGPGNVGVRDCCLLNPYEAIKFVNAARHLVRNITGYPSKRGIYVDECYDIGHIENVHFWPFGVAYQPEDPFCKWVNTQGVAFELARTDWQYIHNTFCFGYGVGYKFSKSSARQRQWEFPGPGRRFLPARGPGRAGATAWPADFERRICGRLGQHRSVCLEIGPEVEGTVSLANCSFWGPVDRCVWMRSAAGQFTASACHFVELGQWRGRLAGTSTGCRPGDCPGLHLQPGQTRGGGRYDVIPPSSAPTRPRVVSGCATWPANDPDGPERGRRPQLDR